MRFALRIAVFTLTLGVIGINFSLPIPGPVPTTPGKTAAIANVARLG